MDNMNRILIFIIFLNAIFSCQSNKKEKTAQPKNSSTEEISLDFEKEVHSNFLQGVNISDHQSKINWEKLKQSDISFVFVKATQGANYIDSEFNNNWRNVKREGFERGAYHYYVSNDDPHRQARHFLDVVFTKSNPTDLPPVLDLETLEGNSIMTDEQFQENVRIWLEIVENNFGRKPIIYTNTNFANKYLTNDFFSDYYLWLADYAVDNPVVPDTWKKVGWTFWENSSSYTIPGIATSFNHNFFAGSIEDLKKL
jgi:lysozyme